MFSSSANIMAMLGDFRIEGMMMRYSAFVPRLYNFCKSLGFESGKIMPSRAFCSDESQGYPIILLAKHFGTFPFNHGQVGGVVATDRHGPHAEHGKDMVIIQASHVGYDPASEKFGTYRRVQTEHGDMTASCGKIESVLDWYENEYAFAQDNMFLERQGDDHLVIIDNQLLNENREEGLFLNLDKMVKRQENREILPLKSYSTSKCYLASNAFRDLLRGYDWPTGRRERLGARLRPELFRYKREIADDLEGRDHLERNLFNPMAWIVTSPSPLLAAAKINTQVEFDRSFRTIVKEHRYWGKKLAYIAGLNIDISPQPGQVFPLTKFVPWAAYVQDTDGSHYTLEQSELMAKLKEQSSDNPDQIDLEEAIQVMGAAQEIRITI